MNPAPLRRPAATAAGELPLLPLLLLLSGITTAGLTGGASPVSCLLLLLGRLTATAEAATDHSKHRNRNHKHRNSKQRFNWNVVDVAIHQQCE
jgi:hypothetical protein